MAYKCSRRPRHTCRYTGLSLYTEHNALLYPCSFPCRDPYLRILDLQSECLLLCLSYKQPTLQNAQVTVSFSSLQDNETQISAMRCITTCLAIQWGQEGFLDDGDPWNHTAVVHVKQQEELVAGGTSWKWLPQHLTFCDASAAANCAWSICWPAASATSDTLTSLADALDAACWTNKNSCWAS